MALLALAVAALTVSSCGPNGRVPVHPTQGRVLIDGKPTPTAMIVLHPVNGDAAGVPKPMAYADKDGTFKVTTYDGKDGAPAGDYAVTVEWRQRDKSNYESIELPPNKLPAKYSTPDKSPLRVHIDAGTNDLGDLKLSYR